MTPPFAIAFFTLAFLGPVALWHFLLHGFLPAWRRNPAAFYVAGALVWVLFAPLAWQLVDLSPQLFAPTPWASAVGFAASGAGGLVFLWSLATLTPRRFFAWAALRPESCEARRVVRGPYRYVAHPSYLALVAAVAGHFLASGHAVLLGAAVGTGFLLSVVAALEQRELRERLNRPLPDRQLAPPPLSPATRD